jgi:hypothetical protein
LPEQTAIPLPHLTNVRGLRDRVSSAACAEKLETNDGNEPFVDRFYGHTWGYTPRAGAAVYGLTANFRSSPIDHLGEGRFLRVPFRRVPIVEVNSVSQLKSIAGLIHSQDKSIKLIWRGQNKEHYLPRKEEETLRFFGEKVLEPSLLPSGARDGLEFQQVFESWSGILDACVREHVGWLTNERPSARNKVIGEAINFRADYNYRLWALATAQHYGLPSVGLDVTPDLNVALLFALYKFTTDRASGETAIERVGEDAEPILYAMGGFENDLFDDADLSPSWLQCQRPKAQSAFFLATGWGLASNKAAERIFMAIRLKDHRSWRLPKRVEELFPSRKEDRFLAFLLGARTRFAPIAKEARLDRVYYAA